MYIRIVTFQLAGPTDQQYRAHAAAVAPAFTKWPGLQAKFWLANPDAGVYGGVYLFDSAAARGRIAVHRSVHRDGGQPRLHPAIRTGVRRARGSDSHHHTGNGHLTDTPRQGRPLGRLCDEFGGPPSSK